MQKVSSIYKESMRSPLRERSYMMISFGLVNQEAQSKSTISKGDFAYYSDIDVIKEKKDRVIYASLEQNFMRADGSTFFLPRQNSNLLKNTGIVSNKLLTQSSFKVTINLNTIKTSIKGFTIDFGDNYPIDFDVISDNGKTYEYRNNTKPVWITEDVMDNTSVITLIFKRMKESHNRVRIYSIGFGYGLVYYNESIIDSTLDSYISPIGADVPQIDFSVQLVNHNRYFNVDNPNSAINYLETGQEMDIMYGYQLPNSDEIEWIQGNHLLCSAWESNDNSATIRCQDIFRNMDSEYYKGRYSNKGRSYYDITLEILKDAKIEKYYIDPKLKSLYTNNPIPRVKHKEALQIIANACRCVLMQSRFGEIKIHSNFIPDVDITSNGEEFYSRIKNINNNVIKDEYSHFSQDNIQEQIKFLPRSNTKNLNVGYISSEISDDNGLFSNNPIVTVTMESVRSYQSMELVFGHNPPSKFIIHSYREGVLVDRFDIEEHEINTITKILRSFSDCNELRFEFVKTRLPNNRIVINNFKLDDVSDFNMTRLDMLNSPTAIKQELIKEVIVPCYSYQQGSKEEALVYEDVEMTIGQTETFFLQDPSYGYYALVDEKKDLADIVEYGDYYVVVRYKVAGEHKLQIQGYRYKIIEKLATKKLNLRGKTIRWKNPMISNMKMANELVNWLADYYKSGIEYEYDSRGNPELDVNDIIYQENEFRDNMKVNVYRYSLKFSQSLSGKVTARRVGG